ncbi:MAG: methionyl-tRNA formyltransferase [Anaerolineales bacterium]|nr:methionyl-tRNA formyltransferase [Chloroflexota bacterium]MBL6981778.1 methionyl-tRNA formyltransferase [Anaerolineales bacterium]
MDTRIVFMGSPDFSLPTLQALADHYQVVGVVTQPDRPAGRGRDLKAPPVKELSLDLGLSVIQPNRLKEQGVIEQLKAWEPDVIVVAAFGQILRSNVLNLPPYGCINVHASLLPRWRGAAPINAAILHGDEETGITIMKMDTGLDTGPIISKSAIPLTGNETAGSLFPKLAKLGADLLMETLPKYLSGKLNPNPQDDAQATYIKMLKRSDGELDFNETAAALERRVRGLNPWPGTYLLWGDQRLKVHRTRANSATSPGVGVFTTKEGFPAVGTSSGLLILDEVQPSGKRPMPGDTFLRGARDWANQ